MEIKNRKALETIINGPAGNMVSWERKIPTAELKMPKVKAKNLYWTRFLAKFLDVTAGIATIAAVKSPPTTFTPKATIKAINKR